jgi:hypothetical protein
MARDGSGFDVNAGNPNVTVLQLPTSVPDDRTAYLTASNGSTIAVTAVMRAWQACGDRGQFRVGGLPATLSTASAPRLGSCVGTQNDGNGYFLSTQFALKTYADGLIDFSSVAREVSQSDSRTREWLERM